MHSLVKRVINHGMHNINRITSTLISASLLLMPLRTEAMEINGTTHFVEVPTKISLINYSWYAFESGAKINFVLGLPKGADAKLGGMNIEQIRGASPAFYFGPVKPKSYLGKPRSKGSEIPVSAIFSEDNRNIIIEFKKPISPGETVTVEFNIVTNPPMDLYVFSVSAIPWGPNPTSQDVGVVQMNIIENDPY